MKKRRLVFGILAVALLLVGLVIAHPHFSKSVSAETQQLSVTVSHFTVPYNPAHLADVTSGFVFHCGRAKVSVGKGALKSGGRTLGAGNYLLRARARSVDDWTLILVPEAEAGADPNNPDLSNGIELRTITKNGQPVTDHLTLDLHGGSGDTDGKLILSVAFGPRTVDGVLDM